MAGAAVSEWRVRTMWLLYALAAAVSIAVAVGFWYFGMWLGG
jgi:hypothetical protein